MIHNLFKISLLFLFLIILSACSTTETLGPQTMQGAMAAEPLGDYHLRPGDRIDIKLFYHQDLNETVIVGPDGKIGLQLVDEVLVAGLTTSQLDDVLTKEYLQYLENVSVSVVVREYSGLRVYVGGEVKMPGFHTIQGSISVLEAILASNGFTNYAKPENVILVRKGPGNRPIAMSVDLGPVLAGKQIENDIYLMPSDIVYVPKTLIAKAGDYVDQYFRRVLMGNYLMEGIGYALGYKWVRPYD